MYEAHTDGGTVIRPTFFEFPDDDKTYIDTEETFMVGRALLVAPVYLPTITAFNVYFPSGKWYNLNDNALIEGSKSVTLPVNNDAIHTFLRAGFMIPFQEQPIDVANMAMTTVDLMKRKISLIAARDE